jgi:hypothetical protein
MTRPELGSFKLPPSAQRRIRSPTGSPISATFPGLCSFNRARLTIPAEKVHALVSAYTCSAESASLVIFFITDAVVTKLPP